MSKLFKAIAQSEQGYQRQSAVATPRFTPSQPMEASQRWWLPATLFVLPSVMVVGYSALASMWAGHTVNPQVNAATMNREIVNSEIVVTTSEHEASEGEVHQVQSLLDGELRDVTFLPYPELVTETLPEANWVQAFDNADPYPEERSPRYEASSSTQTVQPATPKSVAPKPRVVSSQPQNSGWDLDKLDLSELSPELAVQLRSAIEATEDESTAEMTESEPTPSQVAQALAQRPVPQVIAIGDLPAAVQSRLPTLNLQTHIYSSSPKSRWIKVNGREVFEGDKIAQGITLRRIEPRQIVFDFEEYLVAMPALSQW
ncbi:hypothetical protein A3K86_01275 [Photobacterium jeanii]|uniref:Type II secretion system protein GspB C-terminal domain-containing protein n=1 Tax=Photobacterium jeanii TaxID=858640 RepID=A0A178KQ20_9GAMM|nr:general secretion pathway protein GspB [Photobacterium jeanii]OAN19035.1 hypothetical protein A3K86_01275 [Photobacterium jeanii]PST87699.1 hypothetical protein C9I91_18785 [Photobacterium jeanii]